MSRDTGAARRRPQTHDDAREPLTISPEEQAAAQDEAEDPTQPYYRGEFMGRPFHQCPHCAMSGTTHGFIERHVAAAHVRRPPTGAERAAAAGLIVPGNE